MKVKIDTRPLWIVILARWWHFPTYVALAIILYHCYQATPPEGLSLAGFRAFSVFLICLILWVFNLLPLPITGLFALVAPALMGVMSAKQAFSFFGSEPVFFILGVFILAAALLKSGLSTRMALALLRSGVRSPKRLIFQIMLTAALLSFIMSEHAVAAMMFPLVMVIVRSLKFVPQGGSYGRLLFLAMAWGCVVGGIATMLGGGRVPLAIGILEEAGHGTITFMQWTTAMFPIVALVFAGGYWLLTHAFAVDVDSVSEAEKAIADQVAACGRPILEEKFLFGLLCFAILGWMFWGNTIGMATISILAVVFLFMFRVVAWKDLEENVDWGIILMYGGAIGLNSMVHSTGAGLWLAQTYLVPHLESAWGMIMLLIVATMLLTEAMSNSAVVAVLLPIAISIAKSFHLDPKVMVYVVASASGLNFVLPMSTPAIALAYSSGYLKLKEIVLPAALMIVISWTALLLTARFWWPILGIHI